MYQIQKNNIQQAWKNFLVETKRRYKSVFEVRPIVEIQMDFMAKKWLSKSEIKRLYFHDINEKFKQLADAQKFNDDLMASFNLQTMHNFDEGFMKQLMLIEKAKL
jgi:hypothetical protein